MSGREPSTKLQASIKMNARNSGSRSKLSQLKIGVLLSGHPPEEQAWIPCSGPCRPQLAGVDIPDDFWDRILPITAVGTGELG